MPPLLAWAGAAAVLAACAAGAGAVEEAGVDDPRPRVGVAPLQDVTSDADAPTAPDVAPLLAERLEAGGRVRVLPPAALAETLGRSPSGDPEARSVRRWAEREGLDAIVVGKRAADGLAQQVALELRSGHSGASLSRHEGRVPMGSAGEAPLERLAREIEASLGLVDPVAPTAPVAAAGGPAGAGTEPAGPEEPTGATGSGGPTGAASEERTGSDRGLSVSGLDSDGPISIRSDELEVVESGGQRHLEFRRNVRVSQDDITLTTDALEAFYPKGESQPERLEARGRVRVVQRDRRASCDEATYLRSDALITCTGRAELRQGCDVVRGSRITFDLERDRVRVDGAASVVIHPGAEDAGAGAGSCGEDGA